MDKKNTEYTLEKHRAQEWIFGVGGLVGERNGGVVRKEIQNALLSEQRP